MPQPDQISMNTVELALDLLGTAVFAISGAAMGVKYPLDVCGVCVLASSPAMPAGCSGM